MIKVRCAKCGKTLNIPDQFAGKKGKCPGCQEMLIIPAPPAPVEEVEEAQEIEEEPAEEVEAEEEERIADRPANRRSRPDRGRGRGRARGPAGRRGSVPGRPWTTMRTRRGRGQQRRKSAGEWAECPNCGAADATRVRWTWWGGLVGPMIINTVRCNDCGTKYNGVHGDSNTTRIVIYTVIVGLISLVIIGAAVAAAVAVANS